MALICSNYCKRAVIHIVCDIGIQLSPAFFSLVLSFSICDPSENGSDSIEKFLIKQIDN